MNESENTQIITTLAKDAIGKVFISTIPIGGTLINTVWDAVRSYSLEKRRREWEESIEIRLKKLEEAMTIEEIACNDLFVTALMATSAIAFRTAEKEKREYLANAVLNSITNKIDESKLIIFLNLVDKYTVWHIKILDFFQNPLSSERAQREYDRIGMMSSPANLLQSVYPDLNDDRELMDKIVNDLIADGLLNSGSIHGTMTKQGVAAKRTSKLGKEFLDFIAVP